MRKYNLGLIGFGGFGQFLRHCWLDNPHVAVVAAADVNPPPALPDGFTFYNDWKQLLQDPALDIVAIATPPDTHTTIAAAALRANKHVLLEKPLATRVEDARRLLALQARSDRVLAVDFMLRCHPFVRLLKDWVGTGVLGRLRRVLVENYAQDESLPAGHWFWDKSRSGGILIEHGVHFIDLVNYISGSVPRPVHGLRHGRSDRQEDQVLAAVEYEDGLIATHYHDFSRPGFFEATTIRLVFDLAELTLRGWIPLTGEVTALVNDTIREALAGLPNLQILSDQPIAAVSDISRPEGWGATAAPAGHTKGIISGGRTYRVQNLVRGSFKLTKTKQQVYADLVNAVLDDVVATIAQPGHRPFITPAEALSNLEIAAAAQKAG